MQRGFINYASYLKS